MKVTIIIPTYQPKEYIFKCLDSIKEQTLDVSLYEVLIILNGEKDPYYTKIKNYINDNLTNAKLIYTEIKGVSNARNLGLNLAKGENIVFIDDDDYISINYLERLLENKAENTSIVVSNLKCNKNSILYDDYYSKAFDRLKDTDYNLLLFRKFLSSPCGKLIDRKIISNIRFDVDLKTSEDALFCFEISKNINEIVLANSDCIYYRLVRDNSASRKKEKKIDLIREYFLKNKKLSSIYIKSLKEYSFKLYITRILAFSKFLLNRLK